MIIFHVKKVAVCLVTVELKALLKEKSFVSQPISLSMPTNKIRLPYVNDLVSISSHKLMYLCEHVRYLRIGGSSLPP